MPKSKTSDGALFPRTLIVKMIMMRKDWQCVWWWMEINTKKRRKLSTLGFRFIFYFMFVVLLLWVLGRMHKFNYVKVLPINFINFVVLRLVNRTLCVKWVNKDLRWKWWKAQGAQWASTLYGILLKFSVLTTFVVICGRSNTSMSWNSEQIHLKWEILGEVEDLNSWIFLSI